MKGPGRGRSSINLGGATDARAGGTAELGSGINTGSATDDALLLAKGLTDEWGTYTMPHCADNTPTEGLKSSPTRIAAATSLVNLNLGNEISEALDEMFPPLGNSQDFAMTHFPQYQEDSVSVEGDRSYGANDGNMATANDFSAGDLDDNYDKNPAVKSIGGAFSPKKKHCLFLEDS